MHDYMPINSTFYSGIPEVSAGRRVQLDTFTHCLKKLRFRDGIVDAVKMIKNVVCITVKI